MLIRLLLLSCLLVWGDGLASRAGDYLTRDYGRFAVTYCPEDSALADRLVSQLERRLPVLLERLKLPAPDSARFVITPSAEEWGRVTAGSPLWANGIAYPAQGVAVLKSPRFNVNGGPFEETAVHEFVHLMLETGARGAGFPRWFDEGLAQFMAGQQEYYDLQVLSRAAASGRLMRFWDIQGLMSMNAADARQGYAQSLAAIEDLWNRFGDGGLANLISQVRTGKNFDDAFASLFGMPSGQFESQHLGLLRERYASKLWTDGELWISVLFAILVLAAGAVAYWRRQKTVERWRREHLAEEMGEPRDVPYVVNYTLVRERRQEDDDPEEGNRPDRPLPGN